MVLSWLKGYGINQALKGKWDAQKEQQKLWQQSLDLYGGQLAQQNAGFGLAEGYLKKNIGTIGEGFDSAKRLLGGAGQSAKSDIRIQGKQALAGTAQSLTSRGLQNTTVLDNAQRGIHSGMGRELARVNEAISSMLADLEIGKAQGIADAQSALAGFYPQRDAQQLSSLEQYINLMRDKPQDVNKWGDRLQVWEAKQEQIVKAIASFYGGGGGGGSGGGGGYG